MTNIMKINRLTLPCLLAFAASGCSPDQPSGQVIASVGGDDVTRRDIATELSASRIPADARAAFRDAAIERVVERKLLAQEAEREGLDRSPDYLAALRRVREQLLASSVSQRIAATLPAPTEQAVTAYIAGHPWTFERRMMLRLDQVAAAPADLPPLATPDALAKRLAKAGRPFRRTALQVDTADLADADAKRLVLAATGEPVRLGSGDRVAIASVVARRPAPLTGNAARSWARQLISRQALSRAIGDRIAENRRRTSIRYQQGYGPSARSATVAPAAKPF